MLEQSWMHCPCPAVPCRGRPRRTGRLPPSSPPALVGPRPAGGAGRRRVCLIVAYATASENKQYISEIILSTPISPAAAAINGMKKMMLGKLCPLTLFLQHAFFSRSAVLSSTVHMFPAVVLCNRILPIMSSSIKERIDFERHPCFTGAPCEQTAMVKSAVSDLQPESLWRNFQLLASIPRPSKKEQQVLSMLKKFAEDRGLEWRQDTVGNLVIYRKGSGGGESAPPVLIQGHVDMVCAKTAATVHNFFNDPIRLIRDGDWLRADGTTLGADNGIGVSAAMALLELPATAKLPPLECLFTVDEETGLTGAYSFDASLVRRARHADPSRPGWDGKGAGGRRPGVAQVYNGERENESESESGSGSGSGRGRGRGRREEEGEGKEEGEGEGEGRGG